MGISTRTICKAAIVGLFALAGTSSTALASASACSGATCKVPVIPGAKCVIAAYTNAGFTWTLSASVSDTGSPTFNTQKGSGENDTPMKWTSGNGVFKTNSEWIYINYTANGGTNLKMNTGSGFAEGTSAAIMNGEDGQDNDYNDVLVNVSCVK